MQIPKLSYHTLPICIDRFAPRRSGGPLPATRKRPTTATPLFWPFCRPWAMPPWARQPGARPLSVNSASFPGRRRRASTSRCIASFAEAGSTFIASSRGIGISRRAQHPHLQPQIPLVPMPTPPLSVMVLGAAAKAAITKYPQKDTQAAVTQELQDLAPGPHSAPSRSN